LIGPLAHQPGVFGDGRHPVAPSPAPAGAGAPRGLIHANKPARSRCDTRTH